MYYDSIRSPTHDAPSLFLPYRDLALLLLGLGCCFYALDTPFVLVLGGWEGYAQWQGLYSVPSALGL